MKAIVFEKFGEPAEVLQVRDVPKPEVGAGQVRVKMLASPINPSDLMTVRGQYGRLPTLPATPGFEGAGVIDEAGPGLIKMLRRLAPGKRVAVLNGKGGNWQEYVVVPAKQVVPVPDSLPDDQVATLFVNPASALAMVKHVLKVQPNTWLLLSAAGSALGRMVIRLGKMNGFRTIGVVRRREQVQELFDLGASAVVCSSDEKIDDRIKELTSGEGVRYALDAVGGEIGSALVRALGQEGHMLCYGTLSFEPIGFDPRHLMTNHGRVEGFWLTNWIRDQNVLTMLSLFRQIKQLMAEGNIKTEIGGSFPMDEIQKAVAAADSAGKKGKVLIKLS